MNITEVIHKIIEWKGLSNPNDFAKALGYRSAEKINRLFRDASNSPSVDILLDITRAFPEINPAWILTGNEPMFYDDVPIIKNQEQTSTSKKTPYYPNVNASAGLGFLTENGHNYAIPVSIPGVDAQAFINVFGDSMYPKYCSGEIIGIEQKEKDMVQFGHAYVVEMIDGDIYIKYIDPGKDDDHWTLRNENPHYKERQFHLSKIRKIFIVRAVITKTTIK